MLFAAAFAVWSVIALVAVVRVASSPFDDLCRHLVVDDAIYYVQPAQNVVRGHGYSFDGVHVTNGVQPLWALFVLVVTMLLREPETVIRAMVLVGGVLWIAGAALVARLVSRLSSFGGLLAGAIVLAGGMDNRLAMWGMEAGLHCFLIALTLTMAHGVARRSATPDEVRAPLFRLGVVAALLALTRVEYGLFTVLLGVWLSWSYRPYRSAAQALRAVLPYLAPLLVIGFVCVVFSRAYFGEWTPVSGSVKAWVCRDIDTPLTERLSAMGGLSVARTFETVLVWLFLQLASLLGRFPSPGETHLALGLALAPLLSGCVPLFRRLSLAAPRPVLGLALAFVTFLAAHLWLLASVIIAFAGYCGWYMTGEIVGIGLVVGCLAGVLRGWWRLAAAPAAALLLVVLTQVTGSWFERRQTWVTSTYVTGGRFVERWVPPGSTIGCFASGYVAIENPQNRVVNLDGLINDGRYLRDYLMPARVPQYFRDERIGYFIEKFPVAQWLPQLRGEAELPPDPRWIHCWPEGEGVMGIVATGCGDPALPEAPAHPLGALHFEAFVFGRHRILPEAEVAQVPKGEVIVSTCLINGGAAQHVAVAAEHLPEVVDDAGLAQLTSCDARWADAVQLCAVDLPTDELVAGARVAITTYWRALDGLGNGPLPQLHLDVAGREVVAAPALGTLAPGQWQRGVVLPHTFVVNLPADLAPQRYPVVVFARRNGEAGAAAEEPTVGYVQVRAD